MNIKHDFPFDPANGKTLDELLKINPSKGPAGFCDFWKENYALTMAMRPTYFIEREIWTPLPHCRCYVIRAKNWDNTEFVMWISRPEKSLGGLLIGQGYSNKAVPEQHEHLTTCYPCVRGLGRSQCKDIPWETGKHVVHGIQAKETYILRGVISDLWMAVSVMLDMFPDTAENLNYSGASMGGGMGALMLPWDNRFKSASLSVPTFGANIRLDYQSAGSGEACRKYTLEHPEAKEVLEWFDASASAQYLKIPVVVSPAQFDPYVAPVGQFSVANAIPEKYKTLFIRETGHFPQTEHDKQIAKQVQEWEDKVFLSKSRGEADEFYL